MLKEVEEVALSWTDRITLLQEVLARGLDMEVVERGLRRPAVFVMDMKGLFCWKS